MRCLKLYMYCGWRKVVVKMFDGGWFTFGSMEKLNISLFYNTISDERFLTSHCAINLFYQNLTYKNLIGTIFNGKNWLIQRRRPQHQRENIIKNVHRKQGIINDFSWRDKIGNNLGTKMPLRISINLKTHIKMDREKMFVNGFLVSKMRKQQIAFTYRQRLDLPE